MSSSPVVWSGTVTLPGVTAFAAAAEVLGPAETSADTGWDVVPQAVVHMGRTDGPVLSRCVLELRFALHHLERTGSRLFASIYVLAAGA